MRIGFSSLGMESARSYASEFRQSAVGLSAVSRNATDRGSSFFNELIRSETSEDAYNQMEGSMLGHRRYSEGISETGHISNAEEMSALRRIKVQCIYYLLRILKKNSNKKESDISVDKTSVTGNGASNGSTEYLMNLTHVDSSFSEREETDFSTRGSVVTADGRNISFSLNLSMSRNFSAYYQSTGVGIQEKASKLIDPLVINLSESISGLSEQKFLFDIDSDGVCEKISSLNQGSGYLAFDRNGDGIINDGTELFGTESGDGFNDLAVFDDDGDGWIDEDDAIFNKLLIWSKDEKGNDELYRLSEKGVGAICLQRASTEFSLNSLRNNGTNGIIRSTGIFLYENGNVGTVQHLDVAT